MEVSYLLRNYRRFYGFLVMTIFLDELLAWRILPSCPHLVDGDSHHTCHFRILLLESTVILYMKVWVCCHSLYELGEKRLEKSPAIPKSLR